MGSRDYYSPHCAIRAAGNAAVIQSTGFNLKCFTELVLLYYIYLILTKSYRYNTEQLREELGI